MFIHFKTYFWSSLRVLWCRGKSSKFCRPLLVSASCIIRYWEVFGYFITDSSCYNYFCMLWINLTFSIKFNINNNKNWAYIALYHRHKSSLHALYSILLPGHSTSTSTPRGHKRELLCRCCNLGNQQLFICLLRPVPSRRGNKEPGTKGINTMLFPVESNELMTKIFQLREIHTYFDASRAP